MLSIFKKYVGRIQVPLKSYKNNRNFTSRRKYLYDISIKSS